VTWKDIAGSAAAHVVVFLVLFLVSLISGRRRPLS